ncbi:DegT/DnrJ/EryC1/StrS family aminotransferase [Streptomyces acidiscabies]|uniref:DegT/DnrJ/EryC1/StrS aminotransferase n=1 Tax=Streptomyces acidiscabies TaxID=42234 RepID=A0A0L0JLC3_9ACTN|nr:aminotransferase class I/II-fold pyridoxal phosphate-dependent enzyme [Streptomyces acidiscabies]KND26180.1 DegT/DnrJ/EryC1/StrS aminotransferase [Streptomyces acidiscabies]
MTSPAAFWPAYETGDTFLTTADESAAIRAVRERRYYRYDARALSDTWTGRLEHRLAGTLGARHVLACTSGTTAIALSLLALDLPKGSPVACPGFTFAATPSAIVLAGHRPVLVECDEDLHLDVDDLRRTLAAGAAAVVVVHMRGMASDMTAVCAVADAFGVPVVEDAVPVLGVGLGGRALGTYGRLGAFSTQADKPVNTGEGGFLVTDDPDAYARAVIHCGAYEGRLARHFAGQEMPPIDERSLPVYGWRMDEVRAALALSSLDRLPERLALQRAHYDRITGALADLPGIAVRRPVAPEAYSGQQLLFRVPGADALLTARFAAHLRERGVAARTYAGPGPGYNARAYWNWRFLNAGVDALPRTRRLLTELVEVPLSPNLTQAHHERLVSAVTEASEQLDRVMTKTTRR